MNNGIIFQGLVQRVMRERGCDYYEACRVLGQRGGRKAAHLQKQRQKAKGAWWNK